MPTYLALLRAVNLGGETQVSMADLRKMAELMRLRSVRSLLQSGNLAFISDERQPSRLEKRLEAESAGKFKRPLEFFVRSKREWEEITRQNPFRAEAESDPGHLILTLLRDSPSGESWRALERAIVGRERVRGVGRQGYFVYPDGVGRSRLSAALIERKLETRGTSRNWNTVLKLGALASDLADSG
jgi:uncharacterized protein (DUF1697 family)